MGKIIVIEGSDSSGKETQAKLLYENLKKKYNKVIKISFPNYESPACEPVKMYLSGKFGDNANILNPYPISTMYAIDRYASFKMDWEKLYLDDYIIVADRYTTSNMIHQASKIQDEKEKDDYLLWLEDLEYNKIKIPRPDAVFFLNMPTDFALELMKERNNKINGEIKKDIHEKDEKYLRTSYNNALEISKKYAWKKIDCVKENRIRSIDDISKELYEKVVEIVKE